LQGDGTQVNLGTTDDLFVGKDAIITNTDQSTSATPAIIGTGNGHHAEIFGLVTGHYYAMELGTPFGGHDEYVKVGGSGHLVSDVGDALSIIGSHSTVINNGMIEGRIDMWGDDKQTHSTLVNHGTITGPIVLGGEEQFRLVNTGIIVSDGGFFAAASHKSQEITNSGQMVGDIIFGRGSDTYDGHDGMIKGLVAGETGQDQLTGGNGRDHFNGGHGHDILTGGKGADVFSYTFTSDSANAINRRDLITDFSHTQGDLLDLHIIDAIKSDGDNGFNNGFTFIGKDAFSGEAGELHYAFHGDSTFVSADTDGDGHANMSIELEGHVNLAESDFHL
jgi:Ca2+-binding RTX toxin-like protein